MSIRQLLGDCRVTLDAVEPESIQCCVTSPPYYGLRDYGTPPLVWGGDSDCSHIWPDPVRGPWANELPSAKSVTSRNNAFHETMGKTAGQFCPCGAWRGSLGLEPTPEMFIAHLTEVFRAVRRVLRPDGVVWLNLGDSYAGSGKGPSNSLNKSNPHSHEAGKAMKRGLNNLQDTPTSWMPLQRVGPQEHTIGLGRVPGLKPKDLMMMPARVAMALQADGWTLRAQLPWLKKNCMPGSEKDRPTNSVEYVFLLSKSRRYFWDYEAARRNGQPWSTKKPDGWDTGAGGHGTIHRNGREKGVNTGEIREGRNWRTGDLFFESWQGLLVDDDAEPLALVVNPTPFKGSHFATFPPKMVEPMVKASTRPGDVVLDPFAGAGTVGLVADRLGRGAVLCELKPDYGEMSAGRIVSDAPLFVEIEGGGIGDVA